MVGPKKQDVWPRMKIRYKIPWMNDGASKIGHDFRK